MAKFKPKPSVGGHNNPTYAAMIYSVDESIGRVMKVLEDLKLVENTVLIFSSDNGGVGGYIREGIMKASDITDNAPLRSGKGSLYEGGTRDPFIIYWPGVTRPGSVCEVPTIHVDLYPTLLEIAGAARPKHVLDGESLVKLFRNPEAQLTRDAIYQLMEFLEDGQLELYNLRNDISETKNLAKVMPDKAKELHNRLITWRKEVGAPMPTKNDGQAAPTAPKRKPGESKEI